MFILVDTKPLGVFTNGSGSEGWAGLGWELWKWVDGGGGDCVGGSCDWRQAAATDGRSAKQAQKKQEAEVVTAL